MPTTDHMSGRLNITASTSTRMHNGLSPACTAAAGLLALEVSRCQPRMGKRGDQLYNQPV